MDLASKRYYFKIRAVNGCKEGEFSGLSSIGSGPDLFATASPTTTPTPIIGVVAGASTTTVTPEVQGASTEKGTTNKSNNKEGNLFRILLLLSGFFSLGILLWLVKIKMRR